MVKTFVNIIGFMCVPGYPTCECVGSLCVCKMYNNSTLLLYLTAVRSTGTYPSQYIKQAGFWLMSGFRSAFITSNTLSRRCG